MTSSDDDSSLVESSSGGGLISRPQRLGFLPSWRFWRGPLLGIGWKASTRLTKTVGFVLGMLGLTAIIAAPNAPLVWMCTWFCSSALVLGGVERYVRARVEARRERLAGSRAVLELSAAEMDDAHRRAGGEESIVRGGPGR